MRFDIYDLLPTYIQDFVYKSGWEAFREIQKQAFYEILQDRTNVVLSAGTASGKTEAAFFPVLTSLNQKPCDSIAVLYISPLKALINDQFVRLEKILEKGNIVFNKWHGDVSSYQKKKLVENPKGILQITIESLEMLVSHKSETCKSMFYDLRYIIIDEMHYFMDSPRGIQLLSVLERLQRLIDKEPLRIGISATLGDFSVAKRWLSIGSKRATELIRDEQSKRKVSVSLKYFSEDRQISSINDNAWKELYQYLFRMTYGHKSIIFTNSRGDSEAIISQMRMYAAKYGDEELFQIHHGDISAQIREDVEKKMKETKLPYVTGATVTLELGIDIGELERVIQVNAPYSASSFMQRIGRCGRRGQKADIMYVQTSHCDMFFDLQMDFQLLQGIAILQLCLLEKWVEPIRLREKPFAILFHQTMLTIYHVGEITPACLAQEMLTLGSFSKVTQDEYRCLLSHLVQKGLVEKTDTKTLRLTDEGAKLVGSRDFCAVFSKTLDWKVKSEKDGKLIGTVQTFPKEDEEFVLAGWYLKIVQIEWKKREIYVTKTGKKMATKWDSVSPFLIDDKVVQTMKEILQSKESYRYLDQSAQKMVASMRDYAITNDLLTKQLIMIEDGIVLIMLWRGSSFLRKVYYSLKCMNYCVIYEGYYLRVKIGEYGNVEKLQSDLKSILSGEINTDDFNYSNKELIQDKYDDLLPKELLRVQFEKDRL